MHITPRLFADFNNDRKNMYPLKSSVHGFGERFLNFGCHEVECNNKLREDCDPGTHDVQVQLDQVAVRLPICLQLSRDWHDALRPLVLHAVDERRYLCRRH